MPSFLLEIHFITHNLSSGMKKFLLLLTLFLSLAGIAKGDTKEQVMADLGYSDAEAVSSFKVGDVNFAFSNAKYYNSGKSLRMYTGCNITITAPTGYTITGVQFDANSSSGCLLYTSPSPRDA